MLTNTIFKKIEINVDKPESFLQLGSLDDFNLKRKCIDLMSNPNTFNIADIDFIQKEQIYEKFMNVVLTEDFNRKSTTNFKDKIKNKKSGNIHKKNYSSSVKFLPKNLNVMTDLKIMEKLVKDRKREESRINQEFNNNYDKNKNENNKNKFKKRPVKGGSSSLNIVDSDNPFEVIKFFMDQKRYNGLSVNDIKKNLDTYNKTEPREEILNTNFYTQNNTIEKDNYIKTTEILNTDSKYNFSDLNFPKYLNNVIEENNYNNKNEYNKNTSELFKINNSSKKEKLILSEPNKRKTNNIKQNIENIGKYNSSYNISKNVSNNVSNKKKTDSTPQFFFTETNITNSNNNNLKIKTNKNNFKILTTENDRTTNPNNTHNNYQTSTKGDTNINFTLTKEKKSFSNFKREMSFSPKENSLNNSNTIVEEDLSNNIEVLQILAKEEKLKTLNEKIKLIKETSKEQCQESSKDTGKYWRTSMINGTIKSKFSTVSFKHKNNYTNVKSKFKQEKLGNVEKTFKSLLKKNQFMSVNQNKNSKSQFKDTFAKRSTKIFISCDEGDKMANQLLYNTLKNDQNNRELIKGIFNKQSKDWNTQVDQQLKEEGLREYHSKGMFIYGHDQGYHTENYDRLYGVEIGIKPFMSRKKFNLK